MNKKFMFMAILFATVFFCLTSCDDDGNDGGIEKNKYTTSGLYLGIKGFNHKLYPYQYNSNNFRLLTSSSISSFKSHIDGLTIADGTVLYYAVDEAVSDLEKSRFPADLSKVAIVTFTDGLDVGSVEEGDKYESVSAVSQHLKSARVDGKAIDAYAIGIKGNDVGDNPVLIARFEENLRELSSSASNAMEVANMDEVNAKFLEIANSLYNETQTLSVSIVSPGLVNGQRVRFTFDGNLNEATSSTCYIDGVWDRKNNVLSSVTYQGLKCSNGNSVSLTKKETIFYSFTLKDVVLSNDKEFDKSKIQMWLQDGGTWGINSEFDPNSSSDPVVEQKSAVIMLVLDCSKSLGSSGLSQIKKTVKEFIDALYKSSSPDYCRVTFDANGGSGTMSDQMVKKNSATSLKANTFTRSNYIFVGWNTKADGGGKSFKGGASVTFNTNTKLYAQWKTESKLFNGHDYVYLGLPSGLIWATCNVGAENPEDYGDYYSYDDALNIDWGGAWRMPTKAELKEIRNNCTWTWATQNGVRGYKITGPNGNSIFLPAAGDLTCDGRMTYVGERGFWHSSTPDYSDYTWYLGSSSTGVSILSGNRCYGLSVRLVLVLD